jgi:hypothetical protein
MRWKIIELLGFKVLAETPLNTYRYLMSPTELKMQSTIHLQSKAGYGRRQDPGLLCKCIVGCIFNSFGLITREIFCIIKYCFADIRL